MYYTTPHYGYGLDPSAWGTSAFFTMCARRSGSGEECHFFPLQKRRAWDTDGNEENGHGTFYEDGRKFR